MSWLNEEDWFLLFALIMHSGFLLVVVACAVAGRLHARADNCDHTSADMHNSEHQPECEDTKPEFRGQLDDSSIYYEPVKYFPVPVFLYEQPFYIHNPYAMSKKKQTKVNKARNIPQKMNPLSSTEEGTKLENVKTSHKIHDPFDLDIDVKPELREKSGWTHENRSTTDELRLILEKFNICASLCNVWNYRKNRNPENPGTSEGLFAEYDHLSDADLTKEIDMKCLEISNIIEKNLKEIKEKLPKKSTLKTGAEETKGIQYNNEVSTTTTTIKNSKTALEPTYFDEKNAHGNDDFKNLQDKSSSDVNVDVVRSLSTSTTIPSTAVTYSPITSVDNGTEYPLDENTTKLNLNKNIDKSFENQQSNEQFSDSYIEGRRAHPNEKDAPLIKIFSHEFSNDTAITFINGTEESPDNFENESSSTETSGTASETTTVGSTSVTSTSSDMVIGDVTNESLDISGKLYFLHEKYLIPAKFVQEPNDSLHLSIDGTTLCNKLNKDGKQILFVKLCNCLKSDKGTTKK